MCDFCKNLYPIVNKNGEKIWGQLWKYKSDENKIWAYLLLYDSPTDNSLSSFMKIELKYCPWCGKILPKGDKNESNN